MPGVVGRKHDILCIHVWNGIRATGLLASLAAAEHDLRKEGLPRSAARPFRAIVHAFVPFEIVIRLAEPRLFPSFCRILNMPQISQRSVVASLLEVVGDQFDMVGQNYLLLSATTTVMMSTDRRLIHSGDQRRTAYRADRAGDSRVCETHAFARKAIDRGRVDQRFTVAPIVARLILDDDPDDIWSGIVSLDKTADQTVR